jgi:hypothetical protein
VPRGDDIRRLIEQGREAVAEMRSLAHAADAANREFTPDEQVRFNELQVQFQTAAEQRGALEAQNGDGTTVEHNGSGDGDWRPTTGAGGLEEFRSARRTELTDLLEKRDSFEYRRAFYHYLTAAVDWSGGGG